jgi:hypothetical protein
VAVKVLRPGPVIEYEVWVYLFVLYSDVPKLLKGSVERDRYLEEDAP